MFEFEEPRLPHERQRFRKSEIIEVDETGMLVRLKFSFNAEQNTVDVLFGKKRIASVSADMEYIPISIKTNNDLFDKSLKLIPIQKILSQLKKRDLNYIEIKDEILDFTIDN